MEVNFLSSHITPILLRVIMSGLLAL